MNESKLVVIGGDAAGMSAASKVRRSFPEREIVVFERGKHTSYAACGMPYFIGGDVDSADRLVARSPEVIREKMKIDVRTLHEVTAIDTSAKQVTVHDLKHDQTLTESYDDLLIATGAEPSRPPIEGINAHGVRGLSSLQSGIEALEEISARKPKTGVIVGGGYIGIEMAEALLARGMHVSLVDMAPQVMTTMDADMASLISDYMSSQGVHVYLGEKLQRIETDRFGRATAVLTDTQRLPADIVFLGTGVKPNSSLAAEAGIETGARGAIAVNKKLQTSAPRVWAAGDCAESYHLVSQEQVFIALGTVANKHGVVVGTNLSGGDVEFPGVLGTAITKMNELEIARTGLSEAEAERLGRNFESATIRSHTRAGYYPGGGDITVKLLVDKDSGRVIGGQIVGAPGSGKRIDTVATAITCRMRPSDMMNLDLSYAPPFSPVWDPVQVAARRFV